MKIQKIQCENYKKCQADFNNYGKKIQTTLSFAANLPVKKTPFTDKLLKNKFVQKIFNLASLNPHAFNLTIMAVTAILLRPATILIVPGAKKEDKQYAAGKSIISSTLTITTQLALCIPLAKSIEKLAKEAEIKPHLSKFPKINTPRFEAFNYLVNNGFAVVLTVASAMVMSKAVAKIMNKILPDKNRKPKQQDSQHLKTPQSAKVQGGNL